VGNSKVPTPGTYDYDTGAGITPEKPCAPGTGWEQFSYPTMLGLAKFRSASASLNDKLPRNGLLESAAASASALGANFHTPRTDGDCKRAQPILLEVREANDRLAAVERTLGDHVWPRITQDHNAVIRRLGVEFASRGFDVQYSPMEPPHHTTKKLGHEYSRDPNYQIRVGDHPGYKPVCVRATLHLDLKDTSCGTLADDYTSDTTFMVCPNPDPDAVCPVSHSGTTVIHYTELDTASGYSYGESGEGLKITYEPRTKTFSAGCYLGTDDSYFLRGGPPSEVELVECVDNGAHRLPGY